MKDQTTVWGRRLEDLYEACIKLPSDQREKFIQAQAGDDAALAGQLRLMVRLEHPLTADSVSTATPAASGGSGGFDLKSGTQFGNCRILDPIGAGGMGAVYYALDLQNHDRPVALKVMKPTLLKMEDQERFLRETFALSRLVHKNIAQLYFRGIQSWNGTERPFLVMEYVDGVTLDKFLDRRPLTTRQILELLTKIASAVHHGHLKGVFHRDLKPSNILVTADGEPKIIDFGIAFTASTAATPNGEAQAPPPENAGTIPYMAPEVASGAAFVPDARTDVYSLGIIAFEAFARRRPGVELPSGDLELPEYPLMPAEIRRRISECERERLRGISHAFSADLDCIVAKALRLRMDQRYSDASELAEDFRRLLSREPIKARPGSAFYTAKMFVLRNRLAVSAAAAVFLAILASAIVFGVGEYRVKAALRVVEQRNAELHFRSANLAEQRGNWSLAVDEFRLAEAGHYPDRQALMVGELRALGRIDGRSAEVDALIARVHSTMPDIAQSPQFQVVEGFIYWSSKPQESLQTIQRVLRHGEDLSPADRAFAEALTTDDFRFVAKQLRATLESDPFNRDAWALLGFCDLALGEAQRCEQDAGVLQRLYPDDQVGAILAAFAAAFEGRGAAAIEYLDSCSKLPSVLKEPYAQVLDFTSHIRSVDDILGQPFAFFPLISPVASIFQNLDKLTVSHILPIPITFRRFAELSNPGNVIKSVTGGRSDAIYTAFAAWPNGDGDFAAGWLALQQLKYKTAIPLFQAALTDPSLMDCRREAAMALTLAQGADDVSRHALRSEVAATIKPDLDRVISLGGVYPEQRDYEATIVSVGAAYNLYPQVRTLASLWLSHVPDDARAMYFLAFADSHLDGRDIALALYRRALAKGLPADLKSRAQTAIAELTAPAATRPATMP